MLSPTQLGPFIPIDSIEHITTNIDLEITPSQKITDQHKEHLKEILLYHIPAFLFEGVKIIINLGVGRVSATAGNTKIFQKEVTVSTSATLPGLTEDPAQVNKELYALISTAYHELSHLHLATICGYGDVNSINPYEDPEELLAEIEVLDPKANSPDTFSEMYFLAKFQILIREKGYSLEQIKFLHRYFYLYGHHEVWVRLLQYHHQNRMNQNAANDMDPHRAIFRDDIKSALRTYRRLCIVPSGELLEMIQSDKLAWPEEPEINTALEIIRNKTTDEAITAHWESFKKRILEQDI